VYFKSGWNTFSTTIEPSLFFLFTGAETSLHSGVFNVVAAVNKLIGFNFCTSSIIPGPSPCIPMPTSLRFFLMVFPNEFPVGTLFM